MANNLDKNYQNLLQEVIDNGIEKDDRTGTGTLSLFGKSIQHNMREGFPLLTSKKMYFKGVVAELLWFLKGSTDIRELWKNNCNIWDGDWYKKYCTFKKQHNEEIKSLKFLKQDVLDTPKHYHNSFFDMGPIYGKQWRAWEKNHHRLENFKLIDQLQNCIDLLENNPDSRRILVNSWNPSDLDDMVLPPCHYSFQFYTRKLSYKERYDYWFSHNYETGFEYNSDDKIDFDNNYWHKTPERALSLLWNQRSADLFLGVPFNIASYGLLLSIVANQVGMLPEKLIGNFGDIHLYNNHIEQAKEQIQRDSFNLPKVIITDNSTTINNVNIENIKLLGYESYSTIKAPLSN
jgi:thymidylate synthase